MIKVKKLECGIEVVTEKIPNTQCAALGIWTRTGAVNEGKSEAGISHLIEHMMFKGTEERSAKDIAIAFENIGASVNAMTGKELTCYYVKSLSDNLRESMEILADIFLHSSFDPIELKKEKQVIYEEMKMIEDAPDEDAMDTVCQVTFKGLPVSNSIIGTGTSVARIKREDILRYKKQQYTKDSIVISAAGDFDEKAIYEFFEEKMSRLKAKKAKVKMTGTEYSPHFRTKTKDILQTHICMACPSIPADDDRYYAFLLLNHIFGGGMSSRLFQNIREEKGLAYSVCSMPEFFSECGLFTVYAGVAHDKLTNLIEAVKCELDMLKGDGISEKELRRAKEQIKSRRVFGQESIAGRMFTIGKSQLLLNEVISLEETLARIEAVSMDDVADAVEIISDASAYSAVAITDKKVDLKKMVQS